MQGIKAFVGHSFVDEDKTLVRIFTDHFDTLKKLHGSGFMWDHAEEVPLPGTIAASWAAPEGRLQAELKGDQLILSGTYERPASALASITMGSTGAPMPPVKMKIDYRGKLRGQFFVGTLTRVQVGYPSTLLDTPTNVLMILNADGTELQSMENYEASSPRFGTLKAAA